MSFYNNVKVLLYGSDNQGTLARAARKTVYHNAPVFWSPRLRWHKGRLALMWEDGMDSWIRMQNRTNVGSDLSGSVSGDQPYSSQNLGMSVSKER